MKGIVFAEFVEMVEEAFSPEIADAIIEEADLPSGGAYTAVGTYDHAEILELVTRLSEKTDLPVGELVESFGRYMFKRFHTLYPGFFVGVKDSFGFLSLIEEHVHVEVRKLYPDAELPTFDTQQPDDDTLVMEYRSKRPFADLARGLIEGCIEHYQEKIEVQQEDLSGEGRTHVLFTLKKQS